MILEWPVELIEMVLANLHPLQIVMCRLVCRALQEIIDWSSELQPRIELAKDGYLLNCIQRDPKVTIQERVYSHRRLLDTFKHQITFHTTMEGFSTYRYDINDGVMGRLMNGMNHHSVRRITYHELDNREGKKGWEHVWETDMKIVDLSFWASSDIQILTEDRESGVCKRLHFWTISSHSPHPLANASYMDFQEPEIPALDNSHTLMQEGVLVIIFTSISTRDVGRVSALDWKTGEMILRNKHSDDAAFITKDHLLLALKAAGERSAIEIFSLTSREILYQCLLPFPEPVYAISTLQNQNFNCPPNPFTKPQEFMPDPDYDIVGVQVQTEPRYRRSTSIIIISVKSLLEVCSRSALNRSLDWEAWGPQSTTFIPLCLKIGGSLCIFGSRMVVRDTSRDRTQRNFAILDFNPRSLRSGKPSWLNLASFDYSFDHLDDAGDASSSYMSSSLPFRKLATCRLPYYNVDLNGINLVCHEGIDLSVLKLCTTDDKL